MKSLTFNEFKKWLEQYGKASQENDAKTSCYEILAVKENLGIARWKSNFVHIQSGDRLALDCIFLVEFDVKGFCSLFREWWHLQRLEELKP